MSYAIIGAGGIGSFFCAALQQMCRNRQFGFGAITEQDFVVFDPDVVEASNLRHQNFTDLDIGALKAAVMSIRYQFNFRPVSFTERYLDDYGGFIIAADNPVVRKIVYKHCGVYRAKWFIDMRSEGRRTAVFTSKETDTDMLLNTLGANPDSAEGRSCQTEEDTANQVIQLGNMCVAPVGVQILLQIFRKEDYPSCIIDDNIGGKTLRR